MPPTQQHQPDKQAAAAAAMPASASKKTPSSSKKNRRKKSKARIPPYKTYNVVAPSSGGGLQVLRPVNQYDVLCVDGAEAASSKQNGYDYSKQPGNAKYAMLVNLSQSNFNKMVSARRRSPNNKKEKNGGGDDGDDGDDYYDDEDSEAEEQNEESKQVLARSIVETIRDDWKGLFLRKADPSQPTATSTMWVDIGFVESVEEVEMLFERNIEKEQRAHDERMKQEAFDVVKQQRASNGLTHNQGQTPPAHRHVQQPQETYEYQQPVHHHDPQDLETAATGMMTMAAQAPATGTNNHSPMISTLPPLPATGGLSHSQEQPMPSLGVAMNDNRDNSGVPPLVMPPLAHQQEQQQQHQQHDIIMQEPQAIIADISHPPQYMEDGLPMKRKRGRPRKDEVRLPFLQGPKRKRGRPRKTEAEKAADAMKRLKEGKVKQGRRKLINMPGPRDAHSIAPPQEAADGGTLLLSPVGKRSKTFDFRVDESMATQNQDQSAVEATNRSVEDDGKDTIKMIQLPEPVSKFPFPSPLELEANQPRNKIVQARQFVNAKDTEWTDNYDQLACCRISLYCNGQPQRWASGLVRSPSKGCDKKADSTLNHWIHVQQSMYREYCQWETQQILKLGTEQDDGAQSEEQAQQPQQSLRKQMRQKMQKGQQVIVGAAALPEVLPDGIRLPQLGQNGVTTTGSVAGSGGAETSNEQEQECGKEASHQAGDRAKNVLPSGTAQEASAANSLIDTQEDDRELQRAKILLLDDIHFVWQPDQVPPADAPQDWKESFYDLREYLRSRGDTAVPDSVELGVWAQLQRIKYQRSLAVMAKESTTAKNPSQEADPPLTRGQMAALRGLGFDWQDRESSQFHVMYLKLLEFKHRVGDCLVPPPPTLRDLESDEDDDDDDDEEEDCIVETKVDPNLFFWVQRQRLEKIRFQTAQELAEEEQREDKGAQQVEEQAEGVDEDGHALVEELLEEEKEAEETAASKQLKKQNPADSRESEDNDDATVVAHLVTTPSKRTKHARLAAASAEKEGERNAVNSSSRGESENRDSEKKVRRAHAASLSSTKKKTKQRVRSSDTVSTLTQAQINLLDSADFIWSFDISLPWILQYRRLHAFYIKHGHSKVTRSTNQSKTKLNRWCSQVRQLHQRRINGKKFGLTDEKVKLLQRLDFIFEFEDLPERYSFKERFEWLKKYQQQHGSLDFFVCSCIVCRHVQQR